MLQNGLQGYVNDRKYGIFGGLGFNIANHFSIGFGYEQTVANYVAELGGI